jgi:NAD(P)H-nitrite reductase large subunit
VTEIKPDSKEVVTAKGDVVSYDILVIATGSDALLPKHTPGYDAKGVFVYRTIGDLQNLIEFSSTVTGSTGAVVGGGLLGLEAAKAMMDLEQFKSVKLIERNRWVLSRQLDGDAGNLVVDQVRSLGLDVLLSKRVGEIIKNEQGAVSGLVFEDGEKLDCTTICFAVSFNHYCMLLTITRLEFEHAMNLPEKLESSARPAVVALLLMLIFRLLIRTYMPSENVPVGKIKPLALLPQVLRWQMFSHSISHKLKSTLCVLSSVQILVRN